MVSKIKIMLLFFILINGTAIAQEKSRKELKAEKKLEAQRLVDSLVNSKGFVFSAWTAFPQSGRTVDLSSVTNYIKFNPELIESNMPFYGRGYSGTGYTEVGLIFEGNPMEYTITKSKKGFQIEAKVKGENDTYQLFLSIGSEGNASLSVNCINRSGISYNGEISALGKQKVEK